MAYGRILLIQGGSMESLWLSRWRVPSATRTEDRKLRIIGGTVLTRP